MISPIKHSSTFASTLVHNDHNSSLVINENVALLALTFNSRKIIMYNSVPSPNEFDDVKECTTLLIYYIFFFNSVNLSKLIFDVMTSSRIAPNSLSFGMLLALLFKH